MRLNRHRRCSGCGSRMTRVYAVKSAPYDRRTGLRPMSWYWECAKGVSSEFGFHDSSPIRRESRPRRELQARGQRWRT